MRNNKMAFVLAAAMGLGGAQVATAADMPVKASPMAPVPVAFSWTGAYVGVSVGGRWTDANWATDSIGFPAGAPDPFRPNQSFDSLSFRVGGYLGYNWQLSQNWVVGIEGDLAWANSSKTNPGIPGTYGAGGFGPGPLAATLALDSSKVTTNWDGSIRGRLGYLVTPTWLLYATGGVAWQNIGVNAACQGSGVNASWCIAVRDESHSSTRTGWTIGGGLEGMVWGNWLARAEYRYSDYGTFSNTFFAGTVDQFTNSVKVRTHTGLFGIAYKF